MSSFRRFWFPILCSVIVSVSLYDAWLIVLYRDHIQHMEENPIGRWLIDAAGGHVGIFVRCKLAGTILVATALVSLYRLKSRIAFPVTSSIAAYQTGLITYLTFASPVYFRGEVIVSPWMLLMKVLG